MKKPSLQNFLKVRKIHLKVVLFFGLFAAIASPKSLADLVTYTRLNINVGARVGIDYSPTQQSMIASRYHPLSSDKTFARITSSGGVSDFTSASGFPIPGGDNEVKMTVVRTTTTGNFIAGEVYFATGNSGAIGKISAGQTPVVTPATITASPWVNLGNYDTIETNSQITGLWVDRTGVWANDLIVIT